MSCSKCLVDLPADDDFVSCGTCRGKYHYQCSGIQKNTWKAESAKNKSEWKCIPCRNTKSSTDSVKGEQSLEDANFTALIKMLEKCLKIRRKLPWTE